MGRKSTTIKTAHDPFPRDSLFGIDGAYTADERISDVWIVPLFGLAGLAMEQVRLPLASFVIGFVLAPMADAKLRSALMISDGYVTRPGSLGLLLVATACFTCLSGRNGARAWS